MISVDMNNGCAPEAVSKRVCGSRAGRLFALVIGWVRWFVRVSYSAGDRFYWDNGFSRAASLAYASLLSLVPIMALGFGLLASFAVSNQYVPEVRKFLFRQFVPNNQAVDTVLGYLADFSAAISSLNVLVIGILAITSLLLINSIECALNETWQVYEPRPVASRIGIFSSILLLGPALLISSFYFIKFRIEPLLAEVAIGGTFVSTAYQVMLPLVIDCVAFLCLYYLVPHAPVRFRSAFFGALLAAIMFGLAKSLFAYYLAEFASYDRIYKTLSAIPISLFWLYLVWTIVLFGAELSYQAQYLPLSGKVWKRSVLSVGDARLLLAFQSLVIISHGFFGMGRVPNDLELAETLGCSSVVLKPTIDKLEKAGIVVRGDSRDRPLTLRKSPEQVTLVEVQKVFAAGGSPSVRHARELQKLFGFMAAEGGLDRVTLADVIGEKGTLNG